MDRDVTSLMMAPFSGNGRDDFGRDAGARRCLLLDTIMRGRKRESHCRLLQMPAEILADIVDLVADDKPALASLALVNSDCRYLARSCQFAEIQFDYSNSAQQLLLHLAEEALRETDVTARTFPIGVCVRRVTFASRPECVIEFHEGLYNSIFSEGASSYSQEQRNKLRQEAKAHYIALRNISTLAITRAMPNLEVLAWEDSFSIDDEFIKEVSRCSAQHIKLERVRIDKPWLMEPPLTPALWPLRSLDLDVELAHGSSAHRLESEVIQEPMSTEELEIPTSIFFDTLFQRCAATLESLSWQHMGIWSKGRISLGPHSLSFPLLRYLRLGSIFVSPLTFSSLLLSPLKHLELPLPLEGLTECLVKCEPLRDLQSLIIPALPSQGQASMHVADFIRQHKHIHKLFVHELGSTHLDRLVVPILAEGGFSNLRCLSLAWGKEDVSDTTISHVVHIPETALMTLGTIVSLERLSLRAGNNFGWRNRWLIDHDKLRQHLRTLSRLKMLALARDTYPISSFDDIDVEKYYSLRLVGDSDHADARARADLDIDEASAVVETRDMVEDQRNEGGESDEIWERAHRNRMLTQAEAYAAVFPALEWVLCGQRPMGFQCDLESHILHKKAIPLTQHRDECYTFLNRKFGIRQ